MALHVFIQPLEPIIFPAEEGIARARVRSEILESKILQSWHEFKTIENGGLFEIIESHFGGTLYNLTNGYRNVFFAEFTVDMWQILFRVIFHIIDVMKG